MRMIILAFAMLSAYDCLAAAVFVARPVVVSKPAPKVTNAAPPINFVPRPIPVPIGTYINCTEKMRIEKRC